MNSMAVGSELVKRDVIVRRKAKMKTPDGYYKLDGKIYALRKVEVKEKLFCKKCNANNAVIDGSFRDEVGNINYVIKCSQHPDEIYHLEESQFRLRFHGILPNSEESCFGVDGLPKVRSYCRECRGTTGNVVSETDTHYEIKCACGQNWMESKKSFTQKYLGIDGKAPEFEQREPQERNWSDEPDGSQIRQMQDLLKLFNSRKDTSKTAMATGEEHTEVSTVSIKDEITETVNFSEDKDKKIPEKEETMAEEKEENEKTEETLVTFEVAGIKISFREGVMVTVHRVDGQVHVVVK